MTDISHGTCFDCGEPFLYYRDPIRRCDVSVPSCMCEIKRDIKRLERRIAEWDKVDDQIQEAMDLARPDELYVNFPTANGCVDFAWPMPSVTNK